MSWSVSLLGKTEGLIRKVKNSLLRKSNSQFREVERWHNDDPHNIKRNQFDFLNQNSIVFDLGGYEGQWTSDIYSRYQANVYVFEPVSIYADMIRERFIKNERVHVFPFGLAPVENKVKITIEKFSSRVINDGKTSAQTEEILLRSYQDFIVQQNIGQIDLMKLNIEGAEFELLEHMINSGTIKNIRCLLIQFHDFAENAIVRRNEIREQLKKTHVEKFNYPFVWECWEMNK